MRRSAALARSAQPTRDPKDWTLQGSANGTDWATPRVSPVRLRPRDCGGPSVAIGGIAGKKRRHRSESGTRGASLSSRWICS